MLVRDEMDGDRAAIAAVTTAAFDGHPYSSGTEAAIIDGLRRADALALSLVAEENGVVLGHIAFSRVSIGADDRGEWYGLGPLSVRPDRQGGGIGTLLVRAGLERIQDHGARGCVLVGDSGYYSRFGFEQCPRLSYDGVPPDYFLALWFDGPLPAGVVRFHSAFGEH